MPENDYVYVDADGRIVGWDVGTTREDYERLYQGCCQMMTYGQFCEYWQTSGKSQVKQ